MSFHCTNCHNEWPANYCPQCGRTIDRSLLDSDPPALESRVAKSENHRGLCSRRRPVSLAETDGRRLYQEQMINGLRELANNSILVGALWLSIGLIATLATFQLAAGLGSGRYIVAYGPVLYGIFRILRGSILHVKVIRRARKLSI